MKYLFVSIIVPVFNGQKVVAACIESLRAQDYPKEGYEIIIVDNGSTDGTREVIERLSGSDARLEGKTENRQPRTATLRYIYEEVRGSYKARNTGISHAKGEIMVFTDADCIADKSWLKYGVEAFSDKKMGCVAGGIEGTNPTNYVEKYLNDMNMLSQRESSKFFGYLPFAQTANAFYRKEVFKKIGFFEDRWQTAGDADFSWRMQKETDLEIRFIDKALVYHRHRSSPQDFFRQVMKNGEGNVFLYKKYAHYLKQKTPKESLWTMLWIIRSIFKLALYLPLHKDSMGKTKQKAYLDTITFLAREVGRVKGSIKNRTFYL